MSANDRLQEGNLQDGNHSRVFSSLLIDQINYPDVNAVLDSQSQIIKRLDLTNQNLSRANQVSAETFNSFALKDFQSYISLLGKMKTDLDYIFKHIRVVKSKLQTKYPNQYEKAFKENCLNIDDMDDLEELENRNLTEEAKNSDPPVYKDRSISNESGASAKSLFANLLESARTRLSSMELVNGLVNPSASQSTPTPEIEQKSDNNTTVEIEDSEKQTETATLDKQLNDNEQEQSPDNEEENEVVGENVVQEEHTDVDRVNKFDPSEMINSQ